MILVTGGTGFIGSYLVRHLVNQGEDVRLLVRDESKLKLLGVKVDFVKGDVTDKESLKEAFKDVDKVYHLAAIFRHGEDPKRIWLVNYEGTKNVVDEALEHDAKLLHVSTVGVLGFANSEPLDEESPYNPNPNPYAQSKAKAEQYVLKMQKEGLKAAIVRPAFVYGVGSSYGLNLLIDMVVKGKLRFVIGNGKNYIHPIHVRDLIRALVLAMEKGDSIYIAANEKPITLRDFLNLVANCAGIKLRYGLPPKLAYVILKIKGGIGGSSVKETISLFTKNWFYRVDKLKALGWSQEIKIEDGVREVVDWLKTRK
jgi:dihydroflavonol-4-reductase